MFLQGNTWRAFHVLQKISMIIAIDLFELQKVKLIFQFYGNTLNCTTVLTVNLNTKLNANLNSETGKETQQQHLFGIFRCSTLKFFRPSSILKWLNKCYLIKLHNAIFRTVKIHFEVSLSWNIKIYVYRKYLLKKWFNRGQIDSEKFSRDTRSGVFPSPLYCGQDFLVGRGMFEIISKRK